MIGRNVASFFVSAGALSAEYPAGSCVLEDPPAGSATRSCTLFKKRARLHNLFRQHAATNFNPWIHVLEHLCSSPSITVVLVLPDQISVTGWRVAAQGRRFSRSYADLRPGSFGIFERVHTNWQQESHRPKNDPLYSQRRQVYSGINSNASRIYSALAQRWAVGKRKTEIQEFQKDQAAMPRYGVCQRRWAILLGRPP